MALGRELPDDLIADVLRCLPPRSLAASRCVCRAWRDLVDTRRLLRADLLPRSVGGIFINYCTLNSTEFLARPTTGPSISGDLEFIPGSCAEVMDHCNGLVLCTTWTSRGGHDDYVANPATRQWARLPLPPEPKNWFRGIKCLVYDPTVSPHYHVFLKTQREGPVSSDPLQVYMYSSKTDRWEERWFAPEGRVADTTTIADDYEKLYWQGALYLMTENGFVLRISISNAKYTLIPTPDGFIRHRGSLRLGRSEKGVYCTFGYDSHRRQIFHLKESYGQMVWELKHSVDLRTFARKLHAHVDDYGDNQPNGPWILQDINYYKYPYGNDKHKEVVESNFEWNSDDDEILNTEEMVEGHFEGYTHFLGFHPYKEIIFLNASLRRAVAYHWNTSKFQDLGNIYPKDYDAGHVAGIDDSFIYTPCWMEDFPKNCLSVPIED